MQSVRENHHSFQDGQVAMTAKGMSLFKFTCPEGLGQCWEETWVNYVNLGGYLGEIAKLQQVVFANALLQCALL